MRTRVTNPAPAILLNPELGLFLLFFIFKANSCARSTLIGKINPCISPATQGTVGRPEGGPKN